MEEYQVDEPSFQWVDGELCFELPLPPEILKKVTLESFSNTLLHRRDNKTGQVKEISLTPVRKTQEGVLCKVEREEDKEFMYELMGDVSEKN